jgi:ribosomal protein S18 acetylase RimI-like enzyme
MGEQTLMSWTLRLQTTMITSQSSQFGGFQFDKILTVGRQNIPAYRALRLRGLREHPEAFGEAAADFEARSNEQIADRIQTQGQLGGCILAAVSRSGEMLGTVCLAINEPGKCHHRGMIFGMYVIPEARGQNVGKLLLEEALRRADTIPAVEQVHLSVVTSNEAAVRLYEKMGFSTYGTDPRVLRVGDKYYDEYLMVRQVSRTTAQHSVAL